MSNTTRFSTFFIAIAAILAIVAISWLVFSPSVNDADWPMYRYDQSRSAYSPHELPDHLHLHWVRELPQPQRAWPWQMDDFEKLAFDKSYEPIAAEGMLFVPSMAADKVSAYSVETGEEIWHFFADGPVRLAPLYKEGKVYFVSDDGHLYCLDSGTGEKIWKFQAAPGNRIVLGNERLISMWPARGGPVIEDGTLYFAAGIWPHEGVYIYALDPETAEIKWVNSGSPNDLIRDSKRYYSFGGVAPQGQLVVHGDYLLVPGGRTTPAAFNRHTGDLIYYNVTGSTTGKGAGGHNVFARGDWFFNVRDYTVTHMYATVDGAQFGSVNVDLTTQDALIGVDPAQGIITAFASDLDLAEEEPPQPEFDRMGQPLPASERRDASGRAPGVSDRMSSSVLSNYYELRELWRSEEIDGLKRLHVKAGSKLYGSGDHGRIFAVSVPETNHSPQLEWTTTIDGEVFSMIAAHGRLLITTEEGRIYCFGAGTRETLVHEYHPEPLETGGDHWAAEVQELLEELDPRGGYGLMFGVGSGRLLDELLRQSDLHITAFDPDPQKVDELRDRFTRAGLYGRRVAVHQGDVTTYRLPPYIASLIVSEDPDAAGMGLGAPFVQALFHPLRPYGGTAYLALDDNAHAGFADTVDRAGLEKAELTQGDHRVLLTRPGALPGSASWTHQYADAGNTAYSPDKRVKVPLGIAWFGGEPNHKTLPRHMHGPIPQVVEGRLILMGPHHVSARCVYTGIELWATEIPGVGANFTDFEYEAREAPVYFPNHPGANFIGSPLASAKDAVYVIHEDKCLHLDAATGERLNAFEMPDREELKQHGRDPFTREMTESYGAKLQEGEQIKWGHIRYLDDFLIAAAYPHMFDDRQPGRENNWNATSSEFIIIMDRHTGEIKWTHQARYGFRHNAIVAGGGKVYVIDHLSEEIMQLLQRRGIEPDIHPEIRALDIRTGEVLWTFNDEVFGTALAYSAPHDILVQSGHLGRRRALPDEPRDRLLVLHGQTGEMLWDETYLQRRSPLGLHATWGQIIGSTGEGAVDMFTGTPKDHQNPITGETERWSWVAGLRCGTQNFSEHLVTHRSGTAGITDLAGNAMTGNIPGFRSGCTNNLVVADGMFNAPEYTRSCSCSYQHQTSLGLVHMPESEMWTFSTLSTPERGDIKRVGINFAAPGNRLDPDQNVLWVEYPELVGPAPDIPVTVETAGESSLFRHHASWIRNPEEKHSWVASYGISGIKRISMELVPPETGQNHDYDVTIYFTEPEEIDPGTRVFDIVVQGEKVLGNFDIVKQAGGSRRVHRVDVKRVPVVDHLDISFVWNDSSLPAVVSGLEIVRSE